LALAVYCTAASAPAPTNTPAAPKASSALSDLFPDVIVARGKGFEIKRSQLDAALIKFKADAVTRGQTIAPEAMAGLEPQVLDFLIQVQLLLTRATDQDRAQGKEDAAKLVSATLAHAGSEENLSRQLRMVGMTMEDFRAQKLEEATAKVVLQRDIKVSVSDDEVKKFYTENPAPFERPEMVRASHILLATRDPGTGIELSDTQKAAKRKQLEGILKRARAGEDFAKLAADFSEETSPALKSGDYTFARGQMPAEFEAVAFALRTNEVSDIVTTVAGYYIVKVFERLPARQQELAKVAPDIKEYLKQQAIQKQLPDYVEKLKKDAQIEIPDDKLRLPPNFQAPALPVQLPSQKAK